MRRAPCPLTASICAIRRTWSAAGKSEQAAAAAGCSESDVPPDPAGERVEEEGPEPLPGQSDQAAFRARQARPPAMMMGSGTRTSSAFGGTKAYGPDSFFYGLNAKVIEVFKVGLHRPQLFRRVPLPVFDLSDDTERTARSI